METFDPILLQSFLRPQNLVACERMQAPIHCGSRKLCNRTREHAWDIVASQQFSPAAVDRLCFDVMAT
jgi:hypothetical protein